MQACWDMSGHPTWVGRKVHYAAFMDEVRLQRTHP